MPRPARSSRVGRDQPAWSIRSRRVTRSGRASLCRRCTACSRLMRASCPVMGCLPRRSTRLAGSSAWTWLENGVRFPDQQAAAAFAIPGDTALSVASEIAAGHASSTISIGSPPSHRDRRRPGHQQRPAAAGRRREEQNKGGFGGSAAEWPRPRCFDREWAGPERTPTIPTCRAGHDRPAAPDPGHRHHLLLRTGCERRRTAGSVITSVSGQAVGAPEDAAHSRRRSSGRVRPFPLPGHPVWRARRRA